MANRDHKEHSTKSSKLSPTQRPLFLGPHLVAGIWRSLLPEDAQTLTYPKEERATCGACPRVATDDYLPDYRCCTYHPRVPNYLIGMALRDPNARAAVTAEKVRPFLMPEGFMASPQQWATFLVNAGEDQYGKTTNVLCPFLQTKTGFCGIYKYRNGVCSTYFCYHDQGARGAAFWEELQTWMVQVEIALDQWCMAELGFDVDLFVGRMNGLAKSMPRVTRKSDGAWSAWARRIAWGPEWYGREFEFYERAAALVESRQDDLRALVEKIRIREADRFELAGQKLIPKKHRDDVEDDFDDPDRVPLKPKSLWRSVVRAHGKIQR